MADGLTIPGVTDKYKTKDLVQSLMEVERVPLKREEAALETYKSQQEAWRNMNQRMSTLRDSVKTLYSFENPFNNKLASSTEENAVTVDAGREAEYGSFKFEVLNPAAADRFLSAEISKDTQIDSGKYTFRAGIKTIEFNWKGGKLADFVNALNKRGNETIKASLIGVSSDKKSLLIESLKTGAENSLVFENQALEMAKKLEILGKSSKGNLPFSATPADFISTETKDSVVQEGMIPLSKNRVSRDKEEINIQARGGFEIQIPEADGDSASKKIEFLFRTKTVEDLTKNAEKAPLQTYPVLPDPMGITYEGVSVRNNQSETTLPPPGEEKPAKEPLKPIDTGDGDLFYIKDSSGNEKQVSGKYFSKDGYEGQTKASVPLKDFPGAKYLVIRNSNTGKEISMSVPELTDAKKGNGWEPKHAVSRAQDATVKYEGITMNRPENDIDDIVPHLTIHVHDKTERPATIKVDPDTESAKDAIITFVGKYNQTLAEMTILSTNKPEVITELDYLTKEETEEAEKRLGMFQGDFSITNGKSALQQIVSANYRFVDSDEVTMLSQIGVSTNASGGARGYSAAQMRGYLEVDEKKLDSKLKSDLDSIKRLFGYDSDGDLIIDDGIALKLDKQLTSWVQAGGIISSKTGSLDGKIKTSDEKIARLKTQLDRKESELRRKYSAMEGSLNSLEGQSNSINNFANQNSGNRR